MANKPEEWIWSSYRAACGIISCPAFLTTDWFLGQFSRIRNKAQKLYILFVAEGITKESPWKELKGQIFLGDRTFIEKATPRDSIRPKEIPRLQRYADRLSLPELFANTMHDAPLRNKAIYTAHTTNGYTFKEIADHLHIHYTTVSRSIKRAEREIYDCKTSYTHTAE